MVGSGSNLLVADAGVRGLVLKLAGELTAIEREGERVVCGGGVRLPSAAAKVAAWGLGGLEFGINIPGTVGGAVRMNANAYGGQLAEVLEWVDVCTAGGVARAGAGRARVLVPPLGAGRGRGRLARGVRARPGDPAAVKAILAEMRAKRREAQPSGIKTFGSTFKNPDPQAPGVEGRTAGQLLPRPVAAGSRSGAPASRPSTRTSWRTQVPRAPLTCSR